MPNVVVEAKGAPFAVQPSLYGAPSYTNSLTYSSDLTNAAWSQTGTSVSALDAAGLTGAPNTATTLTDDDVASRESVSQTATVPNDSNTNIVRVFIKADADVSRFPYIDVTYSGGTGIWARCWLNTSTGAVSVSNVTGSGATAESNSRGGWWEVLVSQANNGTGNTAQGVSIAPAGGTVVGTSANAATGSIIVGNIELHLNKTIAAVRGSAPIQTTSASVTVSAISMSYDIANHSDENGLYAAKFTPQWSDPELTLTFALVSSRTTTSGQLYSQSDDRIVTYDETGAATSVPTVPFVAGTEYFAAAGYDAGASYMWAQMNSNRSADAAYDGAYSVALGNLTVLGGLTAPCLIRDIRRYSLSLTAGKDKATELAP